MKKVFTLLFVLFVHTLNATPFTPGSIVVVLVGDGTSALSNASTSAYILEYQTDGTLLQTFPLPISAIGSNHILTLSGNAISEGLITRTDDMQNILIVGYDTPPGLSSVSGTAASTVNRTVGRLDINGNLDVTTALSDFTSAGNARSAASTDGTVFWLSGTNGGIRYATLGATTSLQIESVIPNIRQLNIFGGQLYASSSYSSIRLATVGTGLPTTSGQTVSQLPGIPTTGSPYGFFFADLSGSIPGYDVVYIADDLGGLQKYSFDGTTWSSNGVIAVNVAGLTAHVTGTYVTLFATTTTTPNSIIALTDTSGYNATIMGTPDTLVTSPANTAFRGVALSPESITGINTSNPKESISIYPNPFSDQVTFTVAGNEQTTVALYDILGQQILQQTFSKSMTVSTGQLAEGIYFYKIKNSKGSLKTGKLVKQ